MPSQAIIAMAAQHQYDAVATEEGSDESHYPIDEKPPRRRSRYASCPTILQLLPWIIATIAVILLAVGTSKPPSDSQCTAKMSVWSPAFEAVEYQDVQFQNRFSEKSPYRGKPTRELEKAWLDLWNFGPVNIPLDKLNALNKSSDAGWQRAKMDKGGGVVGSLEGEDAFFQHVDHCINSLRIYLQCTADVTPYLILKDERRPLGIDPDFCTRHKCRNFEKIQRWARDHELNTDDYQNDLS
ncbi:hypothetical protein PCL_01006 [Purpureocillium lilacinum]|uniref:Tat pathway signal sequence n=1 Tax=Purpureocillium lilacinum TaxID=33203 RepID=A0A2U3E4E1_PURLI|nr:hypothetical protein PCL_01006 [Purpureocillium lilacinum]